MAATATTMEVVYEQTGIFTVKYNWWPTFDFSVRSVPHRVIKKSDGLFYPQKNEDGAFSSFFIGYKQFSTQARYKSFKTEKGAVNFLKRYIAQEEEETRRLATP